MKTEFINETLFLPEKGILVVGDLHIGYDFMLRQSGVLIPERQINDTIERLEKIFEILKSEKKELKKIIFLGDIKHSFGFKFEEKRDFRKVLDFLEASFEKENIIFIKGNHDTIDYTFENRMKDFHIEEGIAFIHGHKTFLEIFGKNINTIVLGHLHPSIVLEENPGIKKEKYKCFLTGKYKNKNIFILPSFLSIIEGSRINDYSDERFYKDKKEFSIIPKKDLMKFKVHIVGENEIYSFGKVKNFN